MKNLILIAFVMVIIGVIAWIVMKPEPPCNCKNNETFPPNGSVILIP